MSTGKSSGLGCMGVVQVVLIVLKLAGLVDWSWLWVLAPILFEIVVLVVVVAAELTKEAE